ncbi:hypothetical protein [Dongshaea marina]|uniref:hypothetical protein n=1 Tax=Dongshaea marina TaxID=2047966 RepID=UPI000D3EB4CB|nr:hypothetical protein [Dongshaea marina]
MSNRVMARNAAIAIVFIIVLITAFFVYRHHSLSTFDRIQGKWQLSTQQPSSSDVARAIGSHYGYDGQLLDQYVESLAGSSAKNFKVEGSYWVSTTGTHSNTVTKSDRSQLTIASFSSSSASLPFTIKDEQLIFPENASSPFISSKLTIASLSDKTLVLKAAAAPDLGLPAVTYTLVRPAGK